MDYLLTYKSRFLSAPPIHARWLNLNISTLQAGKSPAEEAMFLLCLSGRHVVVY